MALFGNILNIDKVQIDGKILERLGEWLKEVFNQPAWLKALVFLTLTCAGVYFYYNHHTNREYIKELQDQVNSINVEVSENLSIESYKEDLIYVITEIKLLNQQEEQSYNDELLELDLLINFINKHHPNDPIINDFESMKSRLMVNHDVYNQHYKYVIIQLNKVVNDNNTSEK